MLSHNLKGGLQLKLAEYIHTPMGINYFYFNTFISSTPLQAKQKQLLTQPTDLLNVPERMPEFRVFLVFFKPLCGGMTHSHVETETNKRCTPLKALTDRFMRRYRTDTLAFPCDQYQYYWTKTTAEKYHWISASPLPTRRNTNTMNHSCSLWWNKRLSFVPET